MPQRSRFEDEPGIPPWAACGPGFRGPRCTIEPKSGSSLHLFSFASLASLAVQLFFLG